MTPLRRLFRCDDLLRLTLQYCSSHSLLSIVQALPDLELEHLIDDGWLSWLQSLEVNEVATGYPNLNPWPQISGNPCDDHSLLLWLGAGRLDTITHAGEYMPFESEAAPAVPQLPSVVGQAVPHGIDLRQDPAYSAAIAEDRTVHEISGQLGSSGPNTVQSRDLRTVFDCADQPGALVAQIIGVAFMAEQDDLGIPSLSADSTDQEPFDTDLDFVRLHRIACAFTTAFPEGLWILDCGVRNPNFLVPGSCVAFQFHPHSTHFTAPVAVAMMESASHERHVTVLHPHEPPFTCRLPSSLPQKGCTDGPVLVQFAGEGDLDLVCVAMDGSLALCRPRLSLNSDSYLETVWVHGHRTPVLALFHLPGTDVIACARSQSVSVIHEPTGKSHSVPLAGRTAIAHVACPFFPPASPTQWAGFHFEDGALFLHWQSAFTRISTPHTSSGRPNDVLSDTVPKSLSRWLWWIGHGPLIQFLLAEVAFHIVAISQAVALITAPFSVLVSKDNDSWWPCLFLLGLIPTIFLYVPILRLRRGRPNPFREQPQERHQVGRWFFFEPVTYVAPAYLGSWFLVHGFLLPALGCYAVALFLGFVAWFRGRPMLSVMVLSSVAYFSAAGLCPTWRSATICFYLLPSLFLQSFPVLFLSDKFQNMVVAKRRDSPVFFSRQSARTPVPLFLPVHHDGLLIPGRCVG